MPSIAIHEARISTWTRSFSVYVYTPPNSRVSARINWWLLALEASLKLEMGNGRPDGYRHRLSSEPGTRNPTTDASYSVSRGSGHHFRRWCCSWARDGQRCPWPTGMICGKGVAVHQQQLNQQHIEESLAPSLVRVSVRVSVGVSVTLVWGGGCSVQWQLNKKGHAPIVVPLTGLCSMAKVGKRSAPEAAAPRRSTKWLRLTFGAVQALVPIAEILSSWRHACCSAWGVWEGDRRRGIGWRLRHTAAARSQ
jgi:hypothetical protein